MSKDIENIGKILIYQNEKGYTKIDVYFEEETIWMPQKSIAELYQTTPQNIALHIKNIYENGELDELSTCKNYLQVQTEGERQVKRDVKLYNFDMILAIGYRVRNNVGIPFRRWATEILTEYAKKGFVLNDVNIEKINAIGRAAKNAKAVFDYLEQNPIIHIGKTAEELKLAFCTVSLSVNRLVDTRILIQTNNANRNRVFAYEYYLAILRKDT